MAEDARPGVAILSGREWGRALPLTLGLLAAVLAFAQRPGRAYRETRIELTVDPGLFLHRVGSAWSSTPDLGHIQSAQFVGYLWPMGPFYSLGRSLGLAPWVTERLWLALLLGLSAWGAVRVMDELYDRRRGVAHALAGLLYAFTPYTVTYADRTAFLLAYAALPWLVVAAHRGLAAPRSWRWPAIAGLVVLSAGGGLNAAVVAWVVAVPIALIVYEVAVLGARWSAAGAFAWRAGVCAGLGSAWWIVPVLLQSRYGADFLTFTEQPQTILATPSVSESLRVMGFWLEYFGSSFGGPVEQSVPAFASYLFSAPTIVATFAVPLLAFGSLRWTRRWAYAPFFGLVGSVAVVFMALGFPPGSRINDAVTWLYYHASPLQFLRTTYKAAPLLALALACLGGAGAAALLETLKARRPRAAVPIWAGLALTAMVVLWGRPFVSGQVVDPQLAYGTVPLYWRTAIADLDRTTPRDRRALVLPGEVFGWYRWGGTYEPVGPALSHRPLLIRELDRYADPRSAQLQVSADDLLQQGRLVPGQLDPLLRLMGVGQVLVAADGRRARDGALDPARVTGALSAQSGFDRPAARYGTERLVVPPPGWGGGSQVVPDLRRYLMPGGAGPGIVRVHPRAGELLLDGDADGIVELAANGALDPQRAVLYAADLSRRQIAKRVQEGATLAFSDSNRRRRVDRTQLTDNHGPTLGPDDPIPEEDPRYDPFPARGAASRTTAVYSGLRYLRGTPGPPPPQRPYAAFDGDPTTTWIARAELPDPLYLKLELRRPRRVAAIDVLPHFRGGREGSLAVTFNGGEPHRAPLRHGWNRVALPGGNLRTLRLELEPARRGALGVVGLDGLSEVRVPGLRVREALRLPTDLDAAAAGLDLSRNPILVALQRTTTDFPYRTGPGDAHPRQANFRDAESGLVRLVSVPAARRFSLSGWASVDPRADDAGLDRLAGLPPGWAFRSSSRFEGVPGRRASSAFDFDPATAWVGERRTERIPWLEWRAPRPVDVRDLTLAPGPREYSFPSRVRVVAGASKWVVPVGRAGTVTLPRPVRTDRLRLEVLRVSTPTALQRSRRLKAVAIGEVRIRGLRPPRPRRTGTFTTRCGELTLRSGAARADAEVAGSIADLDAGRPHPASRSGPRAGVALPAGSVALDAPPGAIMRPDHLLLSGPAPHAAPAGGVARVVNPGRARDGGRDDVRLSLGAPGWLVLGESYSSGWRAWCRDAAGKERALAKPVPVDGFANGWLVGPSCRRARFRFAAQRPANVAYLISLMSAMGMLLFLLVERVRRRTPRPAGRTEIAGAETFPAVDPVRRPPWPAALAWAAGAGLATGLFAGAATGVAVGVILSVLGRAGITSRRLLAVATLALAAIPIMYVVSPAPLGGVNFGYAHHHIYAHRVAVVAVACVLAACGLELSRLRRDRRAPAAPTSPP